MTPEINRRKLLSAGGVALTVGLAGCSAFADGRGVPGRTEPREDDDENGGEGPEGIPLRAHEYLVDNDANGYDETIEDLTGEDSITIMNGAGSGFAFDPVIVQIDPGTEITWEWTGEGGAHNVESTGPSDSEFRSGDAIDEEGHTWSHTFDEEGVQTYHCSPHTSAGMHAAIVVGDVVDGDGDGDGDEIASYMEENDANLWEGEIEDLTGEDSVTIMNGAGNGFAFDPPAVRVDAGTEVTWEWTGEGGAHNVESTDASEEFRSGEAIDEEGHTWSYTFEETGNHFYHCFPHDAAGMHGVVVVE